MKIDQIKYQNLKGRSEALPLAPMQIIRGVNGTGKTGIHDAIALAFLGYSPRLGKTNPQTAKLASMLPMTVEAYCGADRFRFSLVSKGKGYQSQCEGGAPVMPAILFEPLLWQEASPAARQKMIRDNIRSVQGELKTIWNDLCGKLTSKPSGSPEASYEDRVAATQASLEEAAKAQRALQKRFKETINGIETLDLMADSDFVAPDTDELQTHLTQHTASRAKVLQDIALLDQAIKADTQKVDELTNAIGKLPGLPLMIPADAESALKAAQSERDKIIAQLATLKQWDVTASSRARLEQQIETAKTFQTELLPRPADAEFEAAAHALNRTDYQALSANLESTRRELELVEKALVKAQASHQAALDHKADCPHCGSLVEFWKKKPWDATAAAVEEAADSVQKVKARKTELELNWSTEQARQKALNLVSAYQNAAETADENRERIEALEEELATLPASTGIPGIDSDDEMKLIDHRAQCDAQIEELREILAAWEARKAEQPLREQRTEINERLASAHEAKKRHTDSLEWIESDINNVSQSLARAREQKAELDRRNGLKKQIQDASAAHDEATNELGKISADIDACKEANAAILKVNIKPVIEMANRFLAGVFDWKLDLFEHNIGYWQGAGWVSFDTFSGAQTKIVVAAIQAALAADSPFKLLLLDEAVSIDRKRAGQFYANVAQAIEDGQLDQAVILDIGAEGDDIQTLAESKSWGFQTLR
jgi:hypothetical protein